MEASWGGERPMKVGSAAALKEAAECLPFRAICKVEIFWKRLEEKLKTFGFLWKLENFLSSDAGLNVEDSQMMTVEKTTGLFIGPSMVAYLELNLS